MENAYKYIIIIALSFCLGGTIAAKITHDQMLHRYNDVCAAQEQLSVCGYYEAAMNGKAVLVVNKKSGKISTM